METPRQHAIDQRLVVLSTLLSLVGGLVTPLLGLSISSLSLNHALITFAVARVFAFALPSWHAPLLSGLVCTGLLRVLMLESSSGGALVPAFIAARRVHLRVSR
ncbi:MAG: hypothetical protein QM639_17010 [Rhodocyclaceae bacterium]